MTFEFDLTVTLSLILSVITLIFAYFRTRRQDFEVQLKAGREQVDARLKSGDEKFEAHDLRLSRLEQTVMVMPGKDDMHSLQISLTSMHGDLREMRATMKGSNEIMRRLETIVTRHEDHLLQGAKAK